MSWPTRVWAIQVKIVRRRRLICVGLFGEELVSNWMAHTPVGHDTRRSVHSLITSDSAPLCRRQEVAEQGTKRTGADIACDRGDVRREIAVAIVRLDQ